MNRSVSLFGKEQGQDQENKKEEGRKNCNALRLSGDSSFSRSRTKSRRERSQSAPSLIFPFFIHKKKIKTGSVFIFFSYAKKATIFNGCQINYEFKDSILLNVFIIVSSYDSFSSKIFDL